MIAELIVLFETASKWVNDNQGVVTLAVFLATIALGWMSGIFSALRRRPKFKLMLLGGPSFSCTFEVAGKHQEYRLHRTAIALYLDVSNIGFAASSIERVSVGYHWSLIPFSLQWVRYRLGWFWIKNQTTALTDFVSKIGENIKVYPFLMQRNSLIPASSDAFLEVGRSRSGVVYFEHDGWGGCYPLASNGKAKIKVCVHDIFGRRHVKSFKVPVVSLDQARRYNASFGTTLAKLRGQALPHDLARTASPRP